MLVKKKKVKMNSEDKHALPWWLKLVLLLMLGLTIGVATVVALMAITATMQADVAAKLDEYGLRTTLLTHPALVSYPLASSLAVIDEAGRVVSIRVVGEPRFEYVGPTSAGRIAAAAALATHATEPGVIEALLKVSDDENQA